MIDFIDKKFTDLLLEKGLITPDQLISLVMWPAVPLPGSEPEPGSEPLPGLLPLPGFVPSVASPTVHAATGKAKARARTFFMTGV